MKAKTLKTIGRNLDAEFLLSRRLFLVNNAKGMKAFLLAVVIPAAAFAQTPTIDERLSRLESRVKALEEGNKVQEAQAAEPAPTAAKDSPIELVDWNFSFEVGSYNQARYKITYTVKNTSDKLIKVNQSEIHLFDLLGAKVTSFQIGADLQLPPGKSVTDTRFYSVNQFIPSPLRLKGMAKENVKAVLVVAKAVFADGSIYAAEPK
jgi:hypothetical protein